MPLNLKKEVGSNLTIVLVIPNDTYSECLIDIAKPVSSIYSRTCYVSLNKLYTSLLNSFKNNGVNTSGFFFIDGITKSALPTIEDTDNFKFVESASALQELGIAINNEINKSNYNALIFDSLSTLQIYNKEDIVTEFTRFMLARLRLANCTTFLACLRATRTTGS